MSNVRYETQNLLDHYDPSAFSYGIYIDLVVGALCFDLTNMSQSDIRVERDATITITSYDCFVAPMLYEANDSTRPSVISIQ
ncbi:hypothetical protein PV328_008675 [Microctonus aethiopoides]|uniref:Uncharacterized protein n=1 Tax=Microctonus aethiopoides TaxID=144406 RepID=A0AA39FKB4_9HYME|nr:hypothetical protein PV328_008675 [Microctonus aethiopoides]